MPESTNIANLYLITGRVDGSDDDEVRVVQSDQGLGHAKSIFMNALADSWYDNHGELDDNDQECSEVPPIYISCAQPLADMIAEPMVEDPETKVRITEPQDDDIVTPGW